MAENKVLIDLNICLDTILRRHPFAADALEITERSERGDFTGYIAAHGFDTIFFILQRKLDTGKAYKAIKALRKAYQIAPVTTQTIDKALQMEWNDFEDAIHEQAARASNCEAVVTRNKKDYKESSLTLWSPPEFLQQLNKK